MGQPSGSTMGKEDLEMSDADFGNIERKVLIEDRPSPRHRAGVASMAWRTTLISTQVHEPMREWYNAYDQKALRAKYGNFPKSPRVLARWSAYEPVATAFFDDAAPNSPH